MTTGHVVSEQDVRQALDDSIAKFKSLREMASVIGVSQSHFCRVVRGEKAISGRILDWLGFKRIVAYIDEC